MCQPSLSGSHCRWPASSSYRRSRRGATGQRPAPEGADAPRVRSYRGPRLVSNGRRAMAASPPNWSLTPDDGGRPPNRPAARWLGRASMSRSAYLDACCVICLLEVPPPTTSGCCGAKYRIPREPDLDLPRPRPRDDAARCRPIRARADPGRDGLSTRWKTGRLGCARSARSVPDAIWTGGVEGGATLPPVSRSVAAPVALRPTCLYHCRAAALMGAQPAAATGVGGDTVWTLPSTSALVRQYPMRVRWSDRRGSVLAGIGGLS